MANTDEQQYNPTQYFAARTAVGTNADISLIPTDGPVITADSNLTDEAPVNIALRKDKDTIFGLRGAIFGDFAGAIRKTCKSFETDGVGGNTSTIPAGEIVALSNITTTVGDLLAPGGSCTVDQGVTAGQAVASEGGLVISGSAVGEHAELTEAKLAYLDTGTGVNDANPPQGTSIPNELRGINIPKCSAWIDMQAAGTINSFEGYGIASAVINGGDSHLIDITFAEEFDNTNYTVTFGATRNTGAGVLAMPFERYELRTTAKCTVQVWNVIGAAAIDFAATAINFSVHIDGQQTT